MSGSGVMCAEAERPGHLEKPLVAADRAWPDPASVREAVMRIEALLQANGVAAGQAGLAALVLAEALNNVAEHAFAGLPPAWIRIGLRLDGPRLDLTIADRGAAMPGLVPPKGAEADLDVAREDLPEGGFGWFLIRQLARDVRYERDGRTNRLFLAIDLAALVGPGIPH